MTSDQLFDAVEDTRRRNRAEEMQDENRRLQDRERFAGHERRQADQTLRPTYAVDAPADLPPKTPRTLDEINGATADQIISLVAQLNFLPPDLDNGPARLLNDRSSPTLQKLLGFYGQRQAFDKDPIRRRLAELMPRALAATTPGASAGFSAFSGNGLGSSEGTPIPRATEAPAEAPPTAAQGEGG
jgi:hypothetical protein